jgi:hypothetical protein
MRLAVILVGASLLAPPVFANDEEEEYEPYEGYRLEWSSTFELRLRDFESPADDDDVTGFFDLYEFTRNKDEQPTVDFGLSDFDLDLFGEEETPLIQFRLRSPTSNLNVSGGTFQIDKFFLNQRAELFARFRGLALDCSSRRSPRGTTTTPAPTTASTCVAAASEGSYEPASGSSSPGSGGPWPASCPRWPAGEAGRSEKASARRATCSASPMGPHSSPPSTPCGGESPATWTRTSATPAPAW